MSETNQTYMIKQVWRQKGDALFEQIPFKEENKALELSQTTAPVLLLETKANGGSGAVFAIGRVAKHAVIEQAVEYPGGEFLYHVPYTYEFILSDKKAGITREELQELSGQKFAPQAKGGLYAIEESLFLQVEAMLKERAGEVTAAEKASEKETEVVEAGKAVRAEKAVVAAKTASDAKPAPVKQKKAQQTAAQPDNALLATLEQAQQHLQAHTELRAVIENGTVFYYPAVLVESTSDLAAQQQNVNEYVAAVDKAGLDLAAQEVAVASAAAVSPRFAKIVGLVQRLVSEGKYESVQVPTVQKAFYAAGKLPNPYQAIELKGAQGHHVLGIDGTLYTAEGKTVQHFLGL